MDSYPDIDGKMASIEAKLMEAEVKWSEAAQALVDLQARHALREAQLTMAFKGTGTIPEVQARVVEALWSEPDNLMEDLTKAQAEVEGYKASYKALDRALSGMQSRLAAMIRVDGQQGGQA